MSILLLRDPEKLHDLPDDLESLFWVMVFCALQWFLPSKRTHPMAMFEEEKLDEEGRTVGGVEKSITILGGTLYLETFTCPTLQKLIHECAQCWMEYHLGLRKDPRIDTETMKERIRQNSNPSPALLSMHACMFQTTRTRLRQPPTPALGAVSECASGPACV